MTNGETYLAYISLSQGIYLCLKNWMQQYEEDKDEKSYQGKYFIIEMLVIERFDEDRS